MKPLIALLALCAAAPLPAQVQPRPVGTDPRIQIADYHPDRVVLIRAAPGYQVTLHFGSDERIENVAVGDGGAWQVTPNQRGDLLFVKPLQGGISTNLTVATDVRIYSFELAPLAGDAAEAPFIIRFNYPAAAADPALATLPSDAVQGHYRLGGARSLRPSAIFDDGLRTYISWPEDAALPAVYAIDARGAEALVNGNMRDGFYVIDDVLPRLVFRLDRHAARAVRRAPRSMR